MRVRPRSPRRRAPVPGSTSPAQAAAGGPRPTASRQPTSARTMLWQNASARTVATASPLAHATRPGPAASGSSSRPRAACRTPRSRARRAAAAAASFIAVQVERLRPGQHVVAGQRVHDGRGVGDPVGVAPPQRGEARVEPRPAPATTRRTRTSAGRIPLSRRASASTGGSWIGRPSSARPRRRRRGGRPVRGRAHRCRCGRRRSPGPPGRRSAMASAASRSPWTVRSPGCAAQPWNSVPS